MNLLKDRVLATVVSTLDTAKLFYRTKWSQVREGDVILVPGDEDPLAEVTVKEIRPLVRDDGSKVLMIHYRFGYATIGAPCDPEGVAYVQSRF